MPQERGKAAEAIDCDYCKGRKGKNKQVIHILSRPDRETLVGHLRAAFDGNHFMMDFYTSLWDTAHLIHGHVAKEKYQPLWLIYLEAHGVKVTNRAEAIMHYRAKHGQTEIEYER